MYIICAYLFYQIKTLYLFVYIYNPSIKGKVGQELFSINDPLLPDLIPVRGQQGCVGWLPLRQTKLRSSGPWKITGRQVLQGAISAHQADSVNGPSDG